MRILVVSNLYPPVALGGYEVECAGVVEHLRRNHEVEVLTSARDRARTEPEPGVLRELPMLPHDHRGAVRAPVVAAAAARAARRALAGGPELVYVWNGAGIPHACLRVLADSGLPMAFRVCEHWFGGLFTADQFLRELLPAGRRPARGLWAAGCRAVNRLPGLRLDPLAPFRAAIAWNARALEAMVPTPAFVDVALERVIHSVPRYGDIYARVEREPSDRPEVVFLGRVTPYKGLAIAIEALGLLRERHGIAARLEVIGPEEPDHGRELRALARRLGLEAEVGWRGPLTPEQAAAALARAHAIVVPSDWEEPFPLVTIEAALARVPIVAADVGGIGEGMHDEEHALLFPRGDPAAAATALARALQDGEGTAARVRRAFERAQDFRLGPYLDAQERFVVDALEALAAGGRAPLRSSLR